MSAIPIRAGSPRCTGAPCTDGKREVTWIARIASAAFSGRIDTTSGPPNTPAGCVWMLVRYMGTLQPCSMWRTGRPLSSMASSNENEQPIRNDTRSSRQMSRTSVGSATSSPFFHTR